ncbi:MAG: 4-hydroxy-3-methylbut-2-enyl diphosphate reductase [Syntrophobacterales bacterium]|nr:MAG: 4-hydroxy-3-methylbut-2-enyl diphosphate reductase [Syntrophobacterales bacterium]
MEVIIAKHAGVCFGVKRAIDMAFKAARKYRNHVYTIGPLIHNPQVVDQLKEAGVIVKEEIEDIAKGTVIFRSHGVPFHLAERARQKGLRIVDATCPFVKRTHKFAGMLSRKGYLVIVVGDQSHPEVEGLKSYVEGQAMVVSSPRELADLAGGRKVGVVAQTTQSLENFRAIVAVCLEKAGEIRVYNTICDATALRQREALDFAHKVDCMIVIGGHKSANTKRLAEICRGILSDTHHVEGIEELNPLWFKGKLRIGVVGGASTPNWVIEEIVEGMRCIVSQDS